MSVGDRDAAVAAARTKSPAPASRIPAALLQHSDPRAAIEAKFGSISAVSAARKLLTSRPKTPQEQTQVARDLYQRGSAPSAAALASVIGPLAV